MFELLSSLDSYTECYRLAVQSSYDQMVDSYFGGSQFWAHTIITLASVNVLNAIQWMVVIVFTLIDLFGSTWFARYRIQDSKKYENYPPLQFKYLIKIITNILMNQVLAFAFFVVLVLAKSWLFKTSDHPVVPTLRRFCFEWLVFVATREIFFYYIHIALHTPTLYRRLHKQHHELHHPLAIGTLYSHPVDNLLTNNLPVYVGPVLMHSHMITILLWALYVVTISAYDHSGYNLPFVPLSPEFHDFHHNNSTGNYGLNGLLDWAHGTDKAFRKFQYSQKQQALQDLQSSPKKTQ